MSFQAKGQQLVYAGWLTLTGRDATEEGASEDNQALPVLAQGAHLQATEGEVLDKQTKPPTRYTEASLIKKLEAEGIGRPSTYAAILENILQRGYVALAQRKLQAKELGILIVETLVNRFQFMELGYTRAIEAQLDEIAAGRDQYRRVVSQAYTDLKGELEALTGLRIGQRESHACPACGQPLRLIQGKFWGCSGYPGCRYTAPNENGKPGTPRPRQPQALDTRYPCVCGQGHLQRRTAKGKAFWGCSAYPTCRLTKPDNNGVPGERADASRSKPQAKAGQTCPTCQQGQLVLRTAKKGKHAGKAFYGCTNFPACRHFAWSH
jgi:DNA topoisomerase-1